MPCNHNSHESCSHCETIEVAQRGEHLVVDIHAHLNVPGADEIIRSELPDLPRGMPFSCPASDAVNAKMFQNIAPRLNGISVRIRDMDSQGVDVQVISPNPGQYYYFAPEELGRSLSIMINDTIAEAVASEPKRLVGIGTVPLQNVDMAIAEMRRCVADCGMRGIEIGTSVVGKELAHPDFRPFFKAAEELGVLLFIHPLGFTQGERLSEHYLNNIIGNPLESTIALSHLIFGGVLEQYPRLKICVAHGGGYLPAYWGRMDHAFKARPDCRQHISQPPSSYLSNIWLDTLVFDPQQLQNLIRTHGVNRLCLGTDYPFDMGEPDPVGFLQHVSFLQHSEEDTRIKLLGKNAAELLGLQGVKST